MKYVKIFLVASLTLFGLASCGPKDAGTVGDATVDFYSDNLEGGFASDFLMVPIVLSNNEETTADVTLTVKPAEYTGAFAGEVDKDFMLTTENMVFKPGVDSINLEVMILNKDVEELRFMLEIAETNATAGAKDKILVSLAKSDLDRICTTWEWRYTEHNQLATSWTQAVSDAFQGAEAKVSYSTEYEQVLLYGYENFGVNALYCDYDKKTDEIIFAESNGLFDMGYGGVYIMWYTRDDSNKIVITQEKVTAKANDDFTAINFSNSDSYMAIVKMQGGQLAGVYTLAGYKGLQLVKPEKAKSVIDVPFAAAQNTLPKRIDYKNSGVSTMLDYDRIMLENQIIDALNAQMR